MTNDYDLLFSLAQLTHGEPKCDHCDRAATVMLATAADPDPWPVCWWHACEKVGEILAFGERLFGPPELRSRLTNAAK